MISIESNDADENPLEFGVSGTVSLNLPSAWVIDDGDAGYSASGGWNTYSRAGTQGDFS